MRGTSQPRSSLERRIFVIGAGLVAVTSLTVWSLFDSVHGLSIIVGGVLAAINLEWLRRTVSAIVFYDRKRSKHRILAGFFLRLLLIPLCLYATMRFLVLSIPAAVAGLAVFYCSVFVEGILEAFGSSSKRRARAERSSHLSE